MNKNQRIQELAQSVTYLTTELMDAKSRELERDRIISKLEEERAKPMTMDKDSYLAELRGLYNIASINYDIASARGLLTEIRELSK